MSENRSPSAKVAEAWVDFLKGLAAKSTLRDDVPRFVDYALDRFDAKVVIERLLAPEPSYFAHKDILFAGLSAWTVSHRFPSLTEEAMVIAGTSRMADLEEKKLKEFPQDPLLADFVNRLVSIGFDYYRDFYYPMGGLRRVIRTRSPLLMKRSLKAASKEIGFAVELMRVCHDHANRLKGNSKYRPASVEGAAQAVSKLLLYSKTNDSVVNTLLKRRETSRSVDGTNCKKKAALFHQSMALIYSAYSIELGSETLLSKMCNGSAEFRSHSDLLPEWLGRATFVGSHIINPMFSRGSISLQVDILPAIEPIIFEGPKYG